MDVTAVIVAASRAVETGGEHPLFEDDFAAEFVRAAGLSEVFPVSHAHIGQRDDAEKLRALARHTALRTRFLDDYFSEFALNQAVILAAGLDTRAFRLAWPAGCTVFELDHGAVLDFKQEVLDDADACARCDRRLVPVDLRTDWGGALIRGGFDPKQPTAWLAEGLLPFLPPAAESRLLDRLHELSAVGSSVAVWAMAGDIRGADETVRSTIADFGIDINRITNTEERRDARAHLASLGWTVTESTVDELGERYGRPQRNLPATFFTAQLA